MPMEDSSVSSIQGLEPGGREIEGLTEEVTPILVTNKEDPSEKVETSVGHWLLLERRVDFPTVALVGGVVSFRPCSKGMLVRGGSG